MDRGNEGPKTQSDARRERFKFISEKAKEMARQFEEEIDEALVENQVNMLGVQVNLIVDDDFN